MHLTTKTNIGLGRKGEQRFSKQMGHQNQDRVNILVSDKIDFKPKLVERDKEDFPY
jgi:hypothetical protein